ncbi:signal recognition particle-docking protein FtsY [Dietzia timorensis]|uniref:Signal recognition particle receptor FtsY n=1 Tax=Dietzia timorensis TaxID=499555 RepID=A0A173LLX9_9ACTN|nr:signal recognition particle-docking protein FtsY [Dietzia timorensis]ANI92639.1 Signal recognition particle receptor FtsY [Dietzia timorensis]
MNTTAWIIVAVVVIVLLAILAIAIGLWRRSQNKISFSKETETEEPKEITQQERSGNYQAGTGFSFAPAEKEKVRRDEPSAKAAAPAPEKSAPEKTETPTSDDEATDSQAPEKPAGAGRAAATGAAAGAGAAAAAGAATAAGESKDTDENAETPDSDAEATEKAAVDKDTGTGTAATAEPSAEGSEKDEPAADEAAAEQATEVAGDAPETTHPDTVAVPAPAEPTEEIAPTDGRMHRLRGRLSRSNNTVGKSLLGLLGAGDLDDEAWEEIEDTLIMADLGSETTMRIVDRLRSEIASKQVRTEDDVRALLRQALIDNLHPEFDRSVRALPGDGKPAVILVVGVNGTGKTTTTGKLARVLVADGRTILLGAADTFRAAAADQLQTWGERVGAETVRGKEAADPAAVAFDAVSRGIESEVDAVLVDTAGRLHTKVGLMDQLGKVKRVVEKRTNVDEVLLVIDATTGQNGLQQARVFRDVVDITGVVLTKLDGTAKGGIVFQVQHELDVPVKLVGLGEGADDLAPFVPEAFVDALLA